MNTRQIVCQHVNVNQCPLRGTCWFLERKNKLSELHVHCIWIKQIKQ